MRVRKVKSCKVKAVFRIRGQDQNAVELPCEDWQQAVQKACRVLPHFEQRNPWLYFDSQQQKLHVLLDPDIETFAGARHPKCTIAKARIIQGKENRREYKK
jgi:hypothetical protein